MNKNIAIFINSLESGGAERVVSLLMKNLESKYDIHLVLLEDKFEFEVPKNVSIYLLGSGAKGSIFKILELPILALKLRQYFKRNRISICLSFLSRPNFILGFCKLMGTKTKSIINERTCTSAYHASLDWFSAVISRFLVKSLYPLADMVISNSKYSRRDLISHFNVPIEKTLVIYNPVETQPGDKVSDRKDDGIFTFIHVGKFRPEKNHLLLISAFEKLKELPVRLLLVGKGETEQLVANKVESLGLSEKVSFLGFNPQPFETIAQADCMVLSSDFEGFPNVLLEAMVNGVPIVSVDCFSGPRELLAPETDFARNVKNNIEFGEYGILTPTGNEFLLADAMKAMLSQPDILLKYKANSLDRIKEFEINTIVKKYQNLIDN